MEHLLQVILKLSNLLINIIIQVLKPPPYFSEGSGSDGLSAGVAATIAVVVSLLVVLPVGVVRNML